jgi:hypothetical protein
MMPIKKKTALLASILAAATISLAAGAAEARHGGHGGHGGGGWGGGHGSGGHWRGGGNWGGMAVRPHAFSGSRHFAFRHHHRHARVFAFAPYYDDYGYTYGNGCYWLKRRALYTGSRYWWNRYYGCVNGYDY